MFDEIVWDNSGSTNVIEVNTNLVNLLTTLRAMRTAVTVTPTAGVLLLLSMHGAAPVTRNGQVFR